MKHLKNYFIQFIEKVPSFGKVFICIDDKTNYELIKLSKNKNIITYGTNTKSNFWIKNIKQNINYSEFDLQINVPNKKKMLLKKIKIPLLGIHNVKNSAAAAAVSMTVGISFSDIKEV